MVELSTIDILARLLAAGLLSAVIGFEREARKKPAGMRTNALVGIGTAVVSVASVALASAGGADATDVSRLVASVLPGIGFIGAGTIIHAGSSVRGLTTASSIWVVAAVGIAAGLGMFELAFVGTVLALVALMVLPKLPDEPQKENDSR